MGFFDRFQTPSDPTTYTAPKGIPDPDSPRELVLYQYRSCPYCARVLRAVDALDLGEQVQLRDTMREREARQELLQATGTSQVPCLFVDGVPFHESADIVDWLQAYKVRGVA